MQEFARVLQAIIHGAVQFRKLPDPSTRTHLKNVDQGSGQGANRFKSGAYT
jgi:hypothetical protein